MTPAQWLAWMEIVTAEMARVLTPAGVLVLNVMFKRTGAGWFDERLFDVPRLLRRHGLRLLDVYIYGKSNPVPNGPLTYCDFPGWEPVFVVTKAPRVEDVYFEPYREPYRAKSVRANGNLYTSRQRGLALHPGGARQSTLMLLSSSGDQNRPKAAGQSFPLALPLRFIWQYTRPGEVVFDPFCGVGTTCKAAAALGRRWLGMEKLPGEAETARRWLFRVGNDHE